MRDEEVCNGKRRAKKRISKRADHKHEWVLCYVYFADEAFKVQKCKYCKICGAFKLTSCAVVRESGYFRMIDTIEEMRKYYPDVPVYVSNISFDAFNKLDKFPFA